MKTTELLKKLMAKAGVQHDGEIGDEIPDETATAVDNALLTIQAATNNHPQVKKVYFAQAYNGLDAELNDIITEYGIPDDVKAEIERAGGSTKRATALIRKIKELSDKEKPEDKNASAKHLATINELNGKLAAEIKKQTDLKVQYDNQLEQIKIDTAKSKKLTKYKTVYDDLDPEAKEAAVNAIINKTLQELDAKLAFDDKGNLVPLKNDGTNLFGDNHTLLTTDALLDKSLSKILKVTPPAPSGNRPPATPPIPGSGQDTQNTALKAALAESLANYEASKNGVAI